MNSSHICLFLLAKLTVLVMTLFSFGVEDFAQHSLAGSFGRALEAVLGFSLVIFGSLAFLDSVFDWAVEVLVVSRLGGVVDGFVVVEGVETSTFLCFHEFRKLLVLSSFHNVSDFVWQSLNVSFKTERCHLGGQMRVRHRHSRR